MDEKNTETASRKKRECKDQRLNLRLSKSELEMFNRISYEEDLPMVQIIRNAVKRYYGDRENSV